MPMTPDDSGAIMLGAEALANYARGESHAERVMKSILEQETALPHGRADRPGMRDDTG